MVACCALYWNGSTHAAASAVIVRPPVHPYTERRLSMRTWSRWGPGLTHKHPTAAAAASSVVVVIWSGDEETFGSSRAPLSFHIQLMGLNRYFIGKQRIPYSTSLHVVPFNRYQFCSLPLSLNTVVFLE